MTQEFAVWFLIGLSLVTANLPFVLRRPLLALPWAQRAGEPPRPATEPPGSEGSSNPGDTETDPATGEPNP